jgi:hypothetical protein
MARRTRALAVIPLKDIGWDPVLVDYEDVSLSALTPERLLDECARREGGYERWQIPRIRIGVDSSKPTPPTTKLVEVLPGVVGTFTDMESVHGSSDPKMWIHWMYIPIPQVRAALRATEPAVSQK